MLRFLISLNIVFVFLSLESFSYNNKIWDNWYFGRRAGLTFDTPDKNPKALNNGELNTLEGCASISDTNGVLQFYTNGVFVYNKNHEIMQNGVNLKGHNSSTQSALIIKRPGPGKIYYIFTVDKGPYEGESAHEHCFSIVDMDQNNGLGTVISKNILLHSPVIEKLTAVQHKNGEDFWILARGMNNNLFIVSLLTRDGIVNTKTFEIGPTYFPFPASPEFSLGQLKANPKGDMLATVVYGANNVELYRFDNQQGIITEYLGIPVEEEVTALYGLEFSQNNKFLYVNNLFGRVYQYDVSKFDSLNVYNSMKLVYDSLNYNYQEFGQMQLAPNGKIYLALSYDTSLTVIDKPNVPSPYCDFNMKAQKLNGRLSLFGLPNNVITGTYYSVDIYGRDICIGSGDSLELFSVVYPEDPRYVYEWKGPNGFTSSLANPKILNAGLNSSGKYICNVSLDGEFFRSDSTVVNVFEYPKSEILGFPTICPPEVVKLSSKFKSDEYIYQWSTGSTDSEILINSPGLYHLIITNPAGCTADTAFLNVESADNLSVIFSDARTICVGEELVLSLQTDVYTPSRDYKFKWSTGDTTASIVVSKSGYYSVTVTRNGGCSGTDSVYIHEVEKPTLSLNYEQNIQICSGDFLILEPKDINTNWQYFWADGFDSLSREITQSGNYKLYVENQGNCRDSVEIYIEVNEKPKAEISYNNSLILCYGDSVTLVSSVVNDDYKYQWSDGSIAAQTTVSKSGIYKLIITNDAGCVDSSEVEVFIAPELNVVINASKLYLCLNDSLTLESNDRYSSYKWSTGDTNDFVRIYTPGIYKLTVSNQYGCTDSAEVEVIQISITAELSKSSLTIDSICAGDVAIDELEIIYTSNQAIQFGDYEFIGDSFNFDLEQSIDNVSDGVYVHNVRFISGNNKPGQYSGELIVTIEQPCYNQFSIPVIYNVYSEFEFTAPEIIIQAGNEICIKIDVSSICPNPSDHIYSPEFEIQMVPEHFHPKTVTGGSLIENIYTENLRSIKVKMNEQTFPKSVVRSLEICGTALVGKELASPIEIKNINWGNNYIFNKTKDGSLYIEGCVQDIRGLRLFKPISITVSPNPSSDFAEIIINSQEVGKHFVDIYSTDGKVLNNFELNNFDLNNMQSIKLNTNQFTQGIYQIVVRSPWNILTERLLIIKD